MNQENTGDAKKPESFMIGKSKAWRDLTFNEVVRGSTPGFFAMGGKRDPKQKLKLPGVDWSSKGIDREVAKRVLYNAHLNYIDPLYSEIEPLWGLILVRTFLRVPETQGKIWKPIPVTSMDMINVQTMQRQSVVKQVIESPFKFMTKCVVVSVPPTMEGAKERFKVGDVYAYKPLRTIAPQGGNEFVLTYDYFFAHPDSQLVDPSTRPESRHYGYLMMPTQFLTAKINEIPEESLKLEYKQWDEEVDKIFSKDEKAF